MERDSQAAEIPLLDTHQHLLYRDRFTYPWAAGIPALRRGSFTREDYATAAAGCGIESTLFMETAASNPGEETMFACSLAAEERSAITAVVAGVAIESTDFETQLDRLSGQPVVGVRRVLHVEPDELSSRPNFRANLSLLAARGLTFDLCVLSRQLPIGLELVEACPEVAFVLDHCGVPDIAADALDPWRSDISRLAAMPNVSCKVSGLLAYCRPGNATPEAVRPFVEHSIDAFGWDRVVWGSDWPVVQTTASLRDWVAITRELVATEPAVNQRKLFYENARRIYKLDRVASAHR